MKICMIIGAGFSVPAGMLTVDRISQRFTQPNLDDKILRYSSSEWTWRDMAPSGDKAYGSFSSQQTPMAYLLEELVNQYLSETQTSILNYEDFFQWVIDLVNKSQNKFKELKQKVKHQLEKENLSASVEALNTIPNSEIYSCIFHLIDACLTTQKSDNELIKLYETYTNLFLDENNEIEIYTFNHDLLVEFLDQYHGLNISNGFSTTNSTLRESSNPLPIFDNSFQGRIKLIKLHGSVDQYKYDYMESKNKHKGYDYFKTYDYYAKHFAQDVDQYGNIIQKFNPNVTPQFITGRNKLNLIQNDKMYSELYKRFEQNLRLAEQLLIVGYSFSDSHIETVIQKSKDFIPEIININPNDPFPYAHSNVKNLDPTSTKIKF